MKDKYHHGDLRAALLEAAEALVAERGPEGFSMADAARAASVSAGAPYRHFRDRADLLGQLAARGFTELTGYTRAAREQHPAGSLEALVAFGFAYLEFVANRPGLFHVMWNVTSGRAPHDEGVKCGNEGYALFVETIEQVRHTQGLQHLDAYALGTPLWSMVHGLASLLLGRTDRVNRSPESLFELVDRSSRAYIAGLQQA